MFEKGQLVVCVSTSVPPRGGWLGVNYPELTVNNSYVVHSCIPNFILNGPRAGQVATPGLVLHLVGREHITSTGRRTGFDAKCFRPIEDIADPEKTKVTEDVPATT